MGVIKVYVVELAYCCRSSLNLLLLKNTVTVLAPAFCPRSVLAQLLANVATDAFNEARSETISPKLRLVQMD